MSGQVGNAIRRFPCKRELFQFGSERKEDRRIVGDSGLKTYESDNRLVQIWSTLGSDIGIKIGYRSGPGLTECAFCNFPIHGIEASAEPALSAFSKNPAS